METSRDASMRIFTSQNISKICIAVVEEDEI